MKISKKIMAFVLAVSASFCCTAMPAFAEDTADEEVLVSESAEESDSDYIKSGDYEYSLLNRDNVFTATIEKYTGSEEKVVLPETIDGYDIKALGNFAFYENTKVTEISIPANYEDFGDYAFYGCTSLMEFRVDEKNELYTTDDDGTLLLKGESGDPIAIMAYPTGRNPEKYAVADGILAIKACAFSNCKNLKEITFPDSVTQIFQFAFAECTSLESIVLPPNMTTLSDQMFTNCTALSDITLPENLQTIGNAVFVGCKSLELIDFPASLYEIGQAAFCETGITSITIPSTIQSIGYSAFGFKMNENNDIVQMDNFVIKGYNNSYAQRYSSENGIEFVSLDEPETEAPTSALNTAKKNGMKPGVIAGICAALAAVIAGVVILIVKKGRPQEDETGEDNDDMEDENED